MKNHYSQHFLLSAVLMLTLPSERHPMGVVVATSNDGSDATSKTSTSTTGTSLRRLRQKMVYIPDLFDITTIQDQSTTASSSSEWYNPSRGGEAHREKSQKLLPSAFRNYRRRHSSTARTTNPKKAAQDDLSIEMAIFERLLQDESSMSLSMPPTQPIAPTPIAITPPMAPVPVAVTPSIMSPTVIATPSAPTPVVVAPTSLTSPSSPSVPTPIVGIPSPGVGTPSLTSPVVAPFTPGGVTPSMPSSPSVPTPLFPSTPTSQSVPTPLFPSTPTSPSVPTPSLAGPTSKTNIPNGMMSAGAPFAPTNSGIPTVPISKSKVPSSTGVIKSPSSNGQPISPSSKGQPDVPTSKGSTEVPSLPGSMGEPSSPISTGAMGEPSAPSTGSMGTPTSPNSMEGPSPPSPSGSMGAPSTSGSMGPPTAPYSMEGSSPASPSGSMGAPSTSGSMGDSTTPPAPTPTIFVGESSLSPGGSEVTSRGALIRSKCGVNESDRSQAILGDISTISPLSKLVDETSVAHAALQWLDEEDDLIVCSDGTGAAVQRYVLAMFYYSLNGGEWANCRATTSEVAGSCIDGKPWLDMSGECEWYGIECDSSNVVTKVTLKANNLVGVLPDELFTLTDLIGLSLDHNKYIGGEIPESIGKLTKLTYVELDENFLGGSIPESLYSLSTLQAIDLNGNKLLGTISESVANLSSLAVFQIEDNLFEGGLPTGLASLEELLVLYVHGNNFTGTSLQNICALVDSRRETNVAYLQFLTADCNDSSKVECTCCDCF